MSRRADLFAPLGPLAHRGAPVSLARLAHLAPSLYLALLSALTLIAPSLALAAEDIKPIPKTGPCPPGYYSSGNYCVPNKSAKPVIGKDGPCPPGYYSSGNYCLGRPDSKTVIEKLGPCPPGYYSSGNYCLQSR